MCGNLILPEAIDYVYFYMKLNLRNLLYVITFTDKASGYYLEAVESTKETTVGIAETEGRKRPCKANFILW